MPVLAVLRMLARAPFLDATGRLLVVLARVLVFARYRVLNHVLSVDRPLDGVNF